jgi:hypothetical protein
MTLLATLAIGIVFVAVILSVLWCMCALVLASRADAAADRMAEALTPEPMDHICPHGLPVADCFFSHTQQSEGTGEPMVGIEVALGETGVLDTRPGHGETETQAERMP